MKVLRSRAEVQRVPARLVLRRAKSW